jgi:chemotaxis protein MotB
MEAAGVRPNQVAQVVGYADQQLLNPKDPLDTANRRISIIVRFLAAAGQAVTPTPGEGGPATTTLSSPAPR